MKLIKIVPWFVLVFFTIGCVTKPYVATDYESSYNFAALQAFSIKSTKPDTKENLLISPFTFSHIESLLNSELSKRYQAAGSNTAADFIVSYHVVMEEKLDPRTYDDMYGFGYGGRGYRYPSRLFYGVNLDSGVSVYNQGSLIIDMVDAKTQQPIWRGVSEKRLSKNLSPQQQREILTSALLEVLSRFPPVNK